MHHGTKRRRSAWLGALILAPVLALATAARPATAGGEAERQSLPDDRLGYQMAPILLLSRPDVRADLRLDGRQTVDVEAAIDELYARARALKGQTGAVAVASRKAINEAQLKWLEAHLTPEQQVRLIQVELQWEGPSSLVTRPVVAETLGLTDSQTYDLKRAVAARDSARSRKVYTQVDEQVLAKHALDVLTPHQRERWRAMLGPVFWPQLAAANATPAGESTTTRR